jgi:hypothetical protein
MALQELTNRLRSRYDFAIHILYRRPSLFAVFLSAVSLIRGPKIAFFNEPILQFKPYIGLFRNFVIRGPTFEERIYRE